MRSLCVGIAVVLLAIRVSFASDTPSSSTSDWGTERSATRNLRVSSGRCVGLERQAVCQEAEEKARQQLLEQLGWLAAELTGRELSRRSLLQEKAWLLAQSGVVQHSELKTDEKPYGPVAEKTVSLTIPEAVVLRWSRRLADQQRRRIAAVFCGAGATVLVWLLGMVLAVRLDRATGGYYRRVIVATGVLLLLVVSLLGWGWLLLVG